MILTAIPPECLPDILARFAASLDDPRARLALARIAGTGPARAEGVLAEIHRREALALARSLGMAVLEGAPAKAYGWDGRHLRAEAEAYVLLHEVAHFQLASPTRRATIEFGLGPGPETGDRTGAERARLIDDPAREEEEARASLLGILHEAALGHPALASFLDQNWLEGAGRPAAAHHFTRVVSALAAMGLIDGDCRPTLLLRSAPDAA